jgi:hypothetical protein
MQEFLPPRKEMYNDILRRLRDAVRRNCLKQWRTECWFLLCDDAPAHRTGLFKDFSAKINLKPLQCLLYSPDLALADFHQFSRLKSALKGQRFCNTTDIIKNVTEDLKRLTE